MALVPGAKSQLHGRDEIMRNKEIYWYEQHAQEEIEWAERSWENV